MFRGCQPVRTMDSRFSRCFRESVDPIWWLVIAIVDWSERSAAPSMSGAPPGASPDWRAVAHQLEQLFSQADALLEGREEWQLARFALVVWADDLLTRCQWPGREHWTGGSLEQQLYGRREPGWRFLERADKAWDLPLTEPRETCFLCVCLGLRSVFETPRDHLTPPGLPTTAADWIREVSARGVAGKHVPPIIRYHTQGLARPNEGRQELVRTLVWTALTSVSLLWLAGFLFLRGPFIAD